MGSSNSSKKNNKGKQKHPKKEDSIAPQYDPNFDQNINDEQNFYYNDPGNQYICDKNDETFDNRMNKRMIFKRISENTNHFMESQKYPFDDRRVKFSKEPNYGISSNLSNNYPRFPHHYQQSPMEKNYNPTFGKIQYERSEQSRPLTREAELRRIEFCPPRSNNSNNSQEINKIIYDERMANKINPNTSNKQYLVDSINCERIQSQNQHIHQRIPIQFQEEGREIHHLKRNQSQEAKLFEMRKHYQAPELQEQYYFPSNDSFYEMHKQNHINYEPMRQKYEDSTNNVIIGNPGCPPYYIEENQFRTAQSKEIERRSDNMGKGYFKNRLERNKTNRDGELENYTMKVSQENEVRRIPLSKYY